jgi:Protein kinase domain/Lactonase, 7-bladed beta-propeller
VAGGDYRGPDSFSVGSEVAGYRLEEQIGRGGMAVVYRARDVHLGRNVALKLLAPVLALDDAFRQRFIRESRAAAAVDHPYIIPIFAAGESEGVLFIAMRYVQGGDVRTLIDTVGALPAGRAADIITQVALALDAAHLHGLVHRDIKPANMLLDSVADGAHRDHVYLADFGLSKRSLSVTGLTSIGQFLGTPAYVAPEQVEGRPVDGRADLYALACASFELLSGVPPYERDDDLAVMWAHVSAPPPSLSARRPDLPAGIDAVIAKAMAKAPADRYPACIDFALALRAALGLQVQPPDLAAPAVGPGPPGGRPGAAAHPATEISMPRIPPDTGGGTGAGGPAPEHFGRPAAQGPPSARGNQPRPAPHEPAATPYQAAASSSESPGTPYQSPGTPYQSPGTPYEPPTEDGWLAPLRRMEQAPPGAGARAGSGSPGRPHDRGGAPSAWPEAPSRSRKRSRWWPRGAILIGVVALAGIVIGAVVGLHGGGKNTGATGAGSTPAAGALAALPVPGCSTAAAMAKTLPGVRSGQVSVGNAPFGVVTAADGKFSFVTLANSVAVLSDGSPLSPTLTRVLSAPGANGSGQLTNNGKYLLVAANSGAIVYDVAAAEQGGNAVVGTLTSPFGSGAVEVVFSPDDRFAFVTLENSAALVVFDLQKALANGFGASDVVGKISLNPQPIGMAISPDHRWLYATSRLRDNAPDPSEGTISVIELNRAETTPSTAVVSTASAGCSPVRIITSADGSYVWVTSRESNTLLGFSAAALRSSPSRSLMARVNVGASPIGLAMVDGGRRILVANSNLKGQRGVTTSLSVISTSAALSRSPALLGQISTGLLPREFSVAPDGKTALVTNNGSGQVQGIDLGTLP